MTVTLDAATEQRIQHEINLGHFQSAAEVVARAVALLAAETDWLLRNLPALNERLTESTAQAERGETYSPQEARKILADRREQRLAQQSAQRAR